MPTPPVEIVTHIFNAIEAGAVGIFGATARYFYSLEKENKAVRWFAYFVNAFVGAFVAVMVTSLMPDNPYTIGIAGMSGYACFPIIDMLEKWAVKRVKSFLG